MTATPFFSYDISKSNIDPTLLEEKTFDASTTYFQMPWMILLFVIMFILIIYLLFRKPKKVYISAPDK
jgi:type II secretory pathway component PulF